MIIWERKALVIPCIVSILEARTKVAQFDLWLWMLEYTTNQLIKTFAFEYDWDRNGKGEMTLPTNSLHRYPVYKSGRS